MIRTDSLQQKTQMERRMRSAPDGVGVGNRRCERTVASSIIPYYRELLASCLFINDIPDPFGFPGTRHVEETPEEFKGF